ncbi:MAG: hypothetical protein N2606_04890, partial [Candidatus Omnitrophica bacterium]|nr:hypothetical protein [Candidatus Omnitrophota bacterium]
MKKTIYITKQKLTMGRTKKFFKRFLFLFLFGALGLFLLASYGYAFQVKRVIRGAANMAANTEALPVDLTSFLGGEPLNTDRTLLIFSTSCPAQATNNEGLYRQYGDICGTVDDPQTLLFTRRTSTMAANIEYMVIEFASGATVVSGMTTFPETTLAKTITISQVTYGKSIVFLSQRSWNSELVRDEANIFAGHLLSATQLRLERSEQRNGYNVDLAYQILSFDQTEGDVEVRYGEVNLNGTKEANESSDSGTAVVVPLNPSVSASKSLLMFTTLPNVNVNGVESQYAVDGIVSSDGSSITFRRTSSTNSVIIRYYLAEFKNNVLTQTNRQINITSDTSTTISSGQGFSTPTYANRSIALFSVSVSSGTNTDNLDEIRFRGQLNASGSPPLSSTLTLTREVTDTGVSANISWQVIEFPPLNLTSPNGGEIWKVGETRNITWEYAKELKDNSVTVKLLLSQNGGSSFPLLITTNRPVQDGN